MKSHEYLKALHPLEDLDDLIDQNSLQFVEHNVEEQISGTEINVIINIYE